MENAEKIYNLSLTYVFLDDMIHHVAARETTNHSEKEDYVKSLLTSNTVYGNLSKLPLTSSSKEH